MSFWYLDKIRLTEWSVMGVQSTEWLSRIKGLSSGADQKQYSHYMQGLSRIPNPCLLVVFKLDVYAVQ